MSGSRQPPVSWNIRSAILCCSIIAGATFFAFLPSLGNGFTTWDDDLYVVNNPDIQGFTPRHLSRIFSSSYISNYQPLAMLTYMAEYQFFQVNPYVYHSTNLLVHIVNGLLVFALFSGLSGSRLTGLLAGLLFAVHPLRVESVAWIAERKDVLAGLFFLLSLISYVRYCRTRERKFYWFCLASLVLSLLSKPMAVSQPFVLLCIDYLLAKKPDKKNLLEKVPFLAIAAVFAAGALAVQKTSWPDAGYDALSTVERICVPFYGVIFYLFKSAFPVHLCAFYPFPAASDGGIPWRLLVSPFLVTGIAAAVWRFRNHSRKLVFGSLFFLITALPVLQIVPIGGAVAAERYTYIPMLGIYFIAAAFFRYLLKVKFADNHAVKSLLAAGAAVAVAICCLLTCGRCSVWKDSLSLWNDVIAKHPMAFAYNNRGKVYAARGDHDRALDDFNQAIALNPAYALLYYNRAIVYSSRGDYDRAIEDNTRAILHSPAYGRAYGNRGRNYCLKGDYDRGIADFSRAVMLEPGYAEAYYFRALAYEARNDRARALDDLARACALGDDIACRHLRGN